MWNSILLDIQLKIALKHPEIKVSMNVQEIYSRYEKVRLILSIQRGTTNRKERVYSFQFKIRVNNV